MYVLGLAPAKIGGIEKFLFHITRALDGAGWNTVLCFEGEIAPIFRDFIASPSVTIHIVNGQGNLGFAAAGELRKLLLRYRPEVFVYAFNGVMRCFPWLARAAGARGIFFNDHSSRPPGQKPVPLSPPKRIVGRLLTAPLSGIIAVSEFTRRTGHILGVARAPETVILNGIEVGTPDPARGRAFRERFGIPPESVVITEVCWMVDVKGVDRLLQAAARILPTHPNLRFLFVGEGPERPRYEQLARTLGITESVLFTGLLSNPTTSGLYEATDIYCQPSLWQESSGLAVLEAMSCRIPVVVSGSGGLAENVEDGVSGLLASPDDIDALAGALTRLVEDENLRRRFGEAAHARVVAHHRLEQVAQAYVDVFLRHRASR